LAGLCLLVKD